jgi:mannose-6-phosphate isomerase-like protein (cupin superfamily)
VIARSLLDLKSAREQAGRPYLEFIRVDSMSVGLYVLPAGAVDGQSPHSEDEVYVVIGGRGRFTAGAVTRDVAPGDVLFVPAGMDHRFHDITEELRLAVIFSPPET